MKTILKLGGSEFELKGSVNHSHLLKALSGAIKLQHDFDSPHRVGKNRFADCFYRDGNSELEIKLVDDWQISNHESSAAETIVETPKRAASKSEPGRINGHTQRLLLTGGNDAK